MKDNDVAVPRRTLISRMLSAIERVGNALPHPATLFAILAGILVLLSWLLNRFDAVPPSTSLLQTDADGGR